MTLTQQDIARIYGMYIGAEIQTTVGISTLTTVWVLGKNNQLGTLMPGMSVQRAYSTEQCKLILHSLSNITDEDAIEVARIVGNKSDHFLDGDISMALIGQIIINDKNTLVHRLGGLINATQVVDYLRSKSYMVHHINLFDVGIAIDAKTIEK